MDGDPEAHVTALLLVLKPCLACEQLPLAKDDVSSLLQVGRWFR